MLTFTAKSISYPTHFVNSLIHLFSNNFRNFLLFFMQQHKIVSFAIQTALIFGVVMQKRLVFFV